LLNSNIFFSCPHNMINFGPLMAEIGQQIWGTPANFNRFRSWLHYCTDIAQGRSTKLCMMFGHLLRWYTVFTLLGILPPDGILPGAKFTLRPKSCVLLYWQCYCMALEQWASAKLCGIGQGREFRNFRSLFAPPVFHRAVITLGIGPHSG